MNGDTILINLEYVFDYYKSKNELIRTVEMQYNEYFKNEKRRLKNIERRKRKNNIQLFLQYFYIELLYIDESFYY